MRRILMVGSAALLAACGGAMPGAPAGSSLGQASTSEAAAAVASSVQEVASGDTSVQSCAQAPRLREARGVAVSDGPTMGQVLVLAGTTPYCVGTVDQLGSVLPMLNGGPGAPSGNGDAAGGDPMPAKGGGGDPSPTTVAGYLPLDGKTSSK